jgi:hypothetical protein
MKQATASATVKLKMMKASIRCLVFGLLGLLPIIGVPFALAAMWSSYLARSQERVLWNPAQPHRIVGLICASVGALIWSAVDTILIYHACNNYVNS